MNSMLADFISLGPWSWMILGAILLAIEILLPGTLMLWFGVAAFATGIVTFILPIGLQAQIILFMGASLISVLVGRRFFHSDNTQTDKPYLNLRGKRHIGKTYIVTEEIKNGSGKVKIGDGLWTVSGPDSKVGTKIRVTEVNGNQLTVEHAE